MKASQGSQLFAILLLLIIIVGTAIFVLPLRDEISELKVARGAKSMELQDLQSELDALSALASRVSESETQKQALLSSVPTAYLQDDLILELSQMSEDAGFAMNAVNFSLSTHENFGNTIEITANFSGTYDELIGFLQKLESSKRLLMVTSLNVQRTGTKETAFNLGMEAYYQ